MFADNSLRLKNWNYSTTWWYFITIVTKGRRSYFGEIKEDQMSTNHLGSKVVEEWKKTATLRANVELDYYVVMPNHFHGIIILTEPVGTRRGVSPQLEENGFSKPVTGSLSVIINQFKGAVKRFANKNGYQEFQWQPRFYDRIIRNDKELFNIRRYIQNNPLRWSIVKEQPEEFYSTNFS